MGSDGGSDPPRVAARGHYRMASSQGSLGDICSHAAPSTGDQPDCLTHQIPPASALPHSWSMTCSSGCLPPAGLRRQFGLAVAVVVRVQRYAWRYELIDAIQDLGVQRDVHRRELRLELFQGRGPMIAEVTPGWLIAHASASSIILIPDRSASSASSSTTPSLRWFAAVL